jgi:hypothetical protein
LTGARRSGARARARKWLSATQITHGKPPTRGHAPCGRPTAQSRLCRRRAGWAHKDGSSAGGPRDGPATLAAPRSAVTPHQKFNNTRRVHTHTHMITRTQAKPSRAMPGRWWSRFWCPQLAGDTHQLGLGLLRDCHAQRGRSNAQHGSPLTMYDRARRARAHRRRGAHALMRERRPSRLPWPMAQPSPHRR